MVPGTMGTPAAAIRRRASVLSPMARIAPDGGPMNAMPAWRQASANRQFSDKNPYPGWTASAPVRRAASRMASTLR